MRLVWSGPSTPAWPPALSRCGSPCGKTTRSPFSQIERLIDRGAFDPAFTDAHQMKKPAGITGFVEEPPAAAMQLSDHLDAQHGVVEQRLKRRLDEHGTWASGQGRIRFDIHGTSFRRFARYMNFAGWVPAVTWHPRPPRRAQIEARNPPISPSSSHCESSAAMRGNAAN